MVFLIKKKSDEQSRCPMLNSYFIKLKKTATGGFCRKTVLKNFAIFTGKHLCEIFMNTYFEEYLRTAVSKLTL